MVSSFDKVFLQCATERLQLIESSDCVEKFEVEGQIIYFYVLNWRLAVVECRDNLKLKES